MPEYLFRAARAYQHAYAFDRAELADDRAAIDHAYAIAAAHPEAATVTVLWGERVVARLSVHPSAQPGDADLTVQQTRSLIAKSRQLLRETDPGLARTFPQGS